VKCTKPENVRVDNSKKRTLSLIWDIPRNMGDFKRFLMYKILQIEDGSNNTKVSWAWFAFAKFYLNNKNTCKYVICLPSAHQGVYKNSFRNACAFED